ncbi:4-coumarate--CoA ligase 1-like protein [Leptotrombidium deliense]|uniref:4-coumarate--CoA ligase 1-like protein n=1 Tax=Leptotrombidium deliense TaxID=299467 RepID=A0A443SCE0_9ACAR|nr:4-coumarate--CoA ligase 1-like protein [Leptotrombidium deliense]
MNAEQLLEISDFVVKSKNDFSLQETSVPAVIIQKLIENEDREAMIDCKSEAKWTAKRMLDAIINLAVRFSEFGIKKNDVVAFYAANSDIHTLALLAVWCIGAVYTASLQSNPLRLRFLKISTKFKIIFYFALKLFNLGEIRNVVIDSGAVFIVSCEQNLQICEQLVNEVNVVKKIFVIDGNQEKYISVCSLLNGEISENKKEWFFKQLSAIKSNDLLKVNFSSGTTGKPKATTLRNSNLLAVLATATPGFEFILKDDIVPIVSHYSHTGGTLTLAAALLQGCKIAVVAQFESKTFIEYVQKYNVSKF